MRLLAGWLCLSLASVWLARRMWTLRSPLTRSLYVNMTSGPGGPAAPAGGRKENHQVRARPAGRGRGAPAFPRWRPLCGAAASTPRKVSPPGARPGPRGAFCYLPGCRGLRYPAAARLGRPDPALFPRPRRWLQALGHLGARRWAPVWRRA